MAQNQGGVTGSGPFGVLVHDRYQHFSLRSRHETEAEALAEFERRKGLQKRERPYYVRVTGPSMRPRTWENPDGIGEYG